MDPIARTSCFLSFSTAPTERKIVGVCLLAAILLLCSHFYYSVATILVRRKQPF